MIRWYAPRRPRGTLKGYILTILVSACLAALARCASPLFVAFMALGFLAFFYGSLTKRKG